MKCYCEYRILYLIVIFTLISKIACSRDVRVTLHSQYGEPIESSGSECGAGLYFRSELQLSCACVTGVWAFYNSWCSIPVALVAGSNYCIELESKVTHVSLLSSPDSIYFPSLTWLTSNLEHLKDTAFEDSRVNWHSKESSFISVGAREWELTTPNGEIHCLKHLSNTTSYCYFSDIGNFKIQQVRIGCSIDENIVLPDTCVPFVTGDPKDEEACTRKPSAFEPNPNPTRYEEGRKQVRNIVKRQAQVEDYDVENNQNDFGLDHPPPKVSEPDLAEMPQMPSDDSDVFEGRAGLSDAGGDEDFLDTAQALVKNNPLLMDQLGAHVESEISHILGNTGLRAPARRYPVLQILESSLEVMKKTCDVVSPSYLAMALDTFINIQLDSLHVKEPYIVHPSFLRIQKALAACVLAAGPHTFKQVDSSSVECDDNRKKQSASSTLIKDGKAFNLEMPSDRMGAGFEPIIETVWKILVNAHSYCYKYFSDYYNDHHSYTVSLMPLFTNEIQLLWMPVANNGNYEEPGSATLYGGVIGDHVSLLKNIDFCVAASRVDSAYPWFMNRPPKDTANRWRRRKRSVTSSGHHCLKSPKDVVSKLNLPKCSK